MANFKFTISEPETKKSYQLEVGQDKAMGIVGKKIGDEFSGDILGLSGYMLKITGGTDKDGFPMHPSVKGSVKKRVLLTAPPGFHPKLKGQRKRKTVRGDTISEDMVQINVKVVKKGEKPLEELGFKIKEKPKKEEKVEEKPKETEKPKEEKKPEIKEEKPKEPEKKQEPKEKTEESKQEIKEKRGE